jgi:transposase
VHQSRNAQQQSALQRERRLARYNQVWEMRRHGATIKAIVRQTGVSPSTVRRFLRAERFPERSPCSGRPKRTDAFDAYLRQRWDEGCHNATELFQEIKGRGYQGCYAMVHRLVRDFSPVSLLPVGRPGSSDARGQPTGRSPTPAPPPTPLRLPLPSSRSVAWWLTGHYCTVKPEVEAYQRSLVAQLCERAPVLKEAGELGQRFHRILQSTTDDASDAHEGEGAGEALDGWLQAARHSASAQLRHFVRGLDADLTAVRNAVTLRWSNGQVEGQVNRLKFIKRSMYGRGSFAVLRARVLYQGAA